MNRERNTWLTGAVALLVTLGVLFGGQALWHTFAVAKPLDKAFQGIDGVQSVAWGKEKDEGPVMLQVTIDKAASLQQTYRLIGEHAQGVLGKAPFQIVIHDNRTPELEQVYHELHYHIQEAVFTGRFSDMAEKTQEIAKKAGTDARIDVDARNVYLQLTKGDNGLYVVVPRPNNLSGVK